MSERDVQIKLVADANQFMSKMDQVASKLDRIERSSGDTSRNTAFSRLSDGLNVLGQISGYARGAIDSSIQLIREMDQVADMSKAIGASALGFQEIAYAARFSGIETERLQKALITMNRSVQGEERALELIGMDADALKRMRTDEMFLSIAGALQKVDDAGQRAYISQQIFGREGAKVGAMAAEGREKLEALATEARRFGQAFSDLDVARFEQLNDNIERLDLAMKGAKKTALLEFAPGLATGLDIISRMIGPTLEVSKHGPIMRAVTGGSAAFNWLTGGGDNVGPGGKRKSGDNFNSIAAAEARMAREAEAQALIDRVQGRDPQLQREKLQGMRKDGLLPDDTFWKLMGDVDAQDPNKQALKALEQRAAALTEQMLSPMERYNAAIDEAQMLQEKAGLSQETYNRIVEAAGEEFLKATEKTDAAMERLRQRGESVEASVRTPEEEYQRKIDELMELKNAGEITGETFSRAVAKADAALVKEFGGGKEQGGDGGGIFGALDKALGPEPEMRKGGKSTFGVGDAMTELESVRGGMRDAALRYQQEQAARQERANELLRIIAQNSRQRGAVFG